MRTTMRITWLLLSVSFPFCSTNDVPTISTPNARVESSTSQTTDKNTVQTEITKITIATSAGNSNQAISSTLMPEKSPTEATNPMTITITPAVSTQSQTTAVTITTSSQTNSITGSTSPVDVTTTPAAATTPKPTTQAATSDSSSPTNATTQQKTETFSPSNAAGIALSLPTTESTTVTENDAKSGQQSTPSITVTSSTVAVAGGSPSQKQTPTTSPTGPIGSTEATTTLSILTTTLHPVASNTAGTISSQATTTTIRTTTTTAPRLHTFLYSLNNGKQNGNDNLVEVCKRLMGNFQEGNCTLIYTQNKDNKIDFDDVEITGKVKITLAAQYYEESAKKSKDYNTLIAILASCGALLIMIVILAVCASHHRKPYNENQQHLTEELHTVENGYHDNPTLEVMEVQPEMQEKKVALNGEFNDSWIVPIDNLLKEDIPDEEDTHL